MGTERGWSRGIKERRRSDEVNHLRPVKKNKKNKGERKNKEAQTFISAAGMQSAGRQ